MINLPMLSYTLNAVASPVQFTTTSVAVGFGYIDQLVAFDSSIDAHASTLTVVVAVPEQPFPSVKSYVNVVTPTPATLGSNDPDVTPVPVYVPPTGVPVVNVTALL